MRGFRFRLQDRRLPGKPDIVLPKYGVAIMVNGCFWRGHKGCRDATKPKTSIEFWETKIAKNRHRTEVTEARMHALCWYVITIWECELRSGSPLEDRLNALAEEIREAGASRLEYREFAKRNKAQAKAAQREAVKRMLLLEREIRALYPIPQRIKKESRTDE